MGPCDPKEADSGLLIHLPDAIWTNQSPMRTVDTGVVSNDPCREILLSTHPSLCQDVNIWFAFGTGKSFTYYTTM